MAKKKYQAGGEVVDPYAHLRPATAPTPEDPYAHLRAGAPEPEPDPGLSPFPMERGTSRAAIQFPELAGRASRIFPEDTPLPEEMGMSAAMLLTTDPEEIGMILGSYPNVGIQHAPDGTMIINNLETGERFLANRPGMSAMDWMQMLGLAAAYTPAGRWATVASAGARTAAQEAVSNTLKSQALAQAKRQGASRLMAGSAMTEAGIQGMQELAGGEFNPGEVALATATGALPDYVVDPVVRSGTAAVPVIMGRAKEALPESVTQALRWAEQTGRRVPTSQAMAEFMTPAMNIFFKITERIPFSGTGGTLRRQKAQRADALIELANKFGIDVETDYGRTVMESFVDRLKLRRFWGPNERLIAQGHTRQAQEMMENAYRREAAELQGNVIEGMVRRGQIDEGLVDAALSSGQGRHVAGLMNKLLPEGQAAVRQRFIMRALEHAGYKPGSPSVADPMRFMQFLDDAGNERIMKEIFSPDDLDMLTGAREYLRVTAPAQTAGKGAGMTAAMATTAGSLFLGIADAMVGSAALLGGAGRLAQSRLMRGLLLKIAHAKGDEAATAKWMAELRPVIQAMSEQYANEEFTVPGFDITEEMIKGQGESALEFLKQRAVASGEALMAIPEWMGMPTGRGE